MVFSRSAFFLISCLAFASCQVQNYNSLMNVHAAYEVQCDDNLLVVYFNKTQLDERTLSGGLNNRTYKINFAGDSSTPCTTLPSDTAKVDSNHTTLASVSGFTSSIYINTAFSSCGVNVFQDATHIIYNTTVIVTYGKNPTANVIREEYDSYNVMCLRNRTVESSESMHNVTYRIDGKDAKNDTSDFQFTLDHTDMNNNKQNSYKLGDYIKFGLTFNTVTNGVKGVIQKCWSTSDGSANEYVLINNRCTLEEGSFWVGASTAKSTSFKTEAYRYLGVSNSAITVECLVKVCLSSDGTPSCTFCNSGRKRREVTDETSDETPSGQMTVVKSPVFYIIDRDQPSSSQQESSSFLSGTTGVVLVILVAVLVFVIAAAIIKKSFFGATPVPAGITVGYDNKAMA